MIFYIDDGRKTLQNKISSFRYLRLFSLIIFVAIFLCVLISVPEDFIVLKGAIGDKSSLINLSFVSYYIRIISRLMEPFKKIEWPLIF